MVLDTQGDYTLNQGKRQKDPDDYGTWRDFSESHDSSMDPEDLFTQSSNLTFDSDSEQLEGLSSVIQNLKKKASISMNESLPSGVGRVDTGNIPSSPKSSQSLKHNPKSSQNTINATDLRILQEIASNTFIDQLEEMLSTNTSETPTESAISDSEQSLRMNKSFTYSITHATEFIQQCTIQDLITMQKSLLERKNHDTYMLKAQRRQTRSNS